MNKNDIQVGQEVLLKEHFKLSERRMLLAYTIGEVTAIKRIPSLPLFEALDGGPTYVVKWQGVADPFECDREDFIPRELPPTVNPKDLKAKEYWGGRRT